MEVWGITGLMGAGKSTALRLLQARGLPTIDTDRVARDVLEPTAPGASALLGALRAQFGADVFHADGRLNRAALRERLARGASEQQALEALLHPAILQHVRLWVHARKGEGHEVCFVEGSRLVESGAVKDFSGCILVTAPEALRLERTMARDKSSEAVVRGLFAIQDETRLRGACSVTWRNTGDETALARQIDAFLAARAP